VLWAVPASAQSYVLVIGDRPAPQKPVSHSATLDEQIDSALDHACEKPYILDLKGWQLYKECRTEVRGEIEDQLAKIGEPAAVTIALR
jgi:hypothetical protein